MDSKYVLDALERRIKSDLDEFFESEKTKLVEKLEQEKEKVIVSTMLTLGKYISVETMGETISVRIDKRV
jgi:hypothetical protein